MEMIIEGNDVYSDVEAYTSDNYDDSGSSYEPCGTDMPCAGCGSYCNCDCNCDQN